MKYEKNLSKYVVDFAGLPAIKFQIKYLPDILIDFICDNK